MQSVTRKQQRTLQRRSPARLDEIEVVIFIRSVNFVADDRMSDVRQMHADLMRASRPRKCAHQAETTAVACFAAKTFFDFHHRASSSAVRIDSLLKINSRWLM